MNHYSKYNLTEEQKQRIYNASGENDEFPRLAKEFGVPLQHLYQLRYSWKRKKGIPKITEKKSPTKNHEGLLVRIGNVSIKINAEPGVSVRELVADTDMITINIGKE